MPANLKELDPVQGLVDYVLDIKPYHTKIIEVLVEYIHNDPVDVTILDEPEWVIHIAKPDGQVLPFACDDGYSTWPYGSPGCWPIISPNQNISSETYPSVNTLTNLFIIPGDRTQEFRPGVRVHLRAFIEDYSNVLDIIGIQAGSSCGSPYFVVSGNHTTTYVPGFQFTVFGGVPENNGQYTVDHSVFNGTNTFIYVDQAIPSALGDGKLGLIVTTHLANTATFTITQAVFDHGFIDSWPGFPNPGPPSYVLGNDPHTIITVLEPLTPIPPLGLNQFYVAFATIEAVNIEGVLSYSNFHRDYDPGVPELLQRPDEGFAVRPIVAVTLSTLDLFNLPIPDTGKFTVKGNLQRSNVFVGQTLTVQGSTDNNGTYVITSIVYNSFVDETTFGVFDLVGSSIVDGDVVIDIVSNAFIVDGNFVTRFTQGTVLNVVGGSHPGEYTVLYSDFVDGKTRIRPAEEILDVGKGIRIRQATTTTIEVAGDFSTKFIAGVQFNIVGSEENDGRHFVAINSTYSTITQRTTITVVDPIEPQLYGGEIHIVFPGVIKERIFGFDEHSDICNLIPDTIVHVKIDEQLDFEGLQISLKDDLIAYNLENTDNWGFVFPKTAIFKSTPPTIFSQPLPPPLPPAPNDVLTLWFDTSTNVFRQWNGHAWGGIVTAYWFDTANSLFYYRTKNAFIDTNWLLAFTKTPGFGDVFGATAKVEFVGFEFFNVEEISGVPQITFTLFTLEVPHWSIVGVDSTPGDSKFIVSGDVRGPYTVPGGHRLLVIETPGNVNNGTYTIRLDPTFAVGQTTIYIQETIPSAAIGGNIIFDKTLLTVTVDGVPAGVTINKVDQFTIDSPPTDVGDDVIVRVFDITGDERNAFAMGFGLEPHSVFHFHVDVDTVNNAFIVGGGNFINKFTPDTRFKGLEITPPGSDFVGEWQATSFPIVLVDEPNREIEVNTDLTWLFQPGRVFATRVSENNYQDFMVESSLYDLIADRTVITTTTTPDVFEVLPLLNPGIPTRNIDNISDTVEVWANQTSTFVSGLEVLFDLGINIIVVNTLNQFVVQGDQTLLLLAGIKFRVSGSSFNNDHLVYDVVSSSLSGGNTLVNVIQAIPDVVAGGRLLTKWTVSSSSFIPPLNVPANDPDSLGYTIINIVEDIPVHVHVSTDSLIVPIVQNYSRDLGVILGAVYDPFAPPPLPSLVGFDQTSFDDGDLGCTIPPVDLAGFDGPCNPPSRVGSQVRTIVVPTSAVSSLVEAITYIWIGPLRIDVHSKYQVGSDVMIGDSINLVASLNSYDIILTDSLNNQFTIHRDLPIVHAIEQSNAPSDFFRVAGNFTSRFVGGFQFTVTNSAGNNGTYTTLSSSLVDENNNPWVLGAGAQFTRINVVNVPASSVNNGELRYTLNFDVSDSFTPGTIFEVFNSANNINNHKWVVGAITFDGTNNIITVETNAFNVPPVGSSTVDQSFFSAISTISSISQVPDFFVVTGDFTFLVPGSDTIVVFDTLANDGQYTVTGTSYNGLTNQTTINVVENIPAPFNLFQVGKVGVLGIVDATVPYGKLRERAVTIEPIVHGNYYDIVDTDVGNLRFGILGNQTVVFSAGQFRVDGSFANDRVWSIDRVYYDGAGETPLVLASTATDEFTISGFYRDKFVSGFPFSIRVDVGTPLLQRVHVGTYTTVSSTYSIALDQTTIKVTEQVQSNTVFGPEIVRFGGTDRTYLYVVDTPPVDMRDPGSQLSHFILASTGVSFTIGGNFTSVFTGGSISSSSFTIK